MAHDFEKALVNWIGSAVACPFAPQDNSEKDSYPRVAYALVSEYQAHSLKHVSAFYKSQYQVDCWALTYQQAKSTAKTIKDLVDGHQGIIGIAPDVFYVQASFITDSIDRYEEPKDGSARGIHGVTLEFDIWYEERD